MINFESISINNKKWLIVVLLTSLISSWLSYNKGSQSAYAKIDNIELKLQKLLGSEYGEEVSFAPTSDLEYHTTEEARTSVERLGSPPPAEKLAEEFAVIDSWAVKPEEEKDFQAYKLEMAALLRKQVKQEVLPLQKAALAASSSKESISKHSEAGRILALYPISQDKEIIEEAKSLSSQQIEIASRIEVLRRQRYNRWASERIELAIKGYNTNKSSIPYRTDRPKLVASLIESLGAVDPALLEPAVLDLYNYCIDNTKGVLYEAEKIDLAKQLTDPTNARKTLGDF